MRRYDATWRKLRKMQLSKEPLCAFCRKVGKITPATVADHIVPIRNDPEGRLDSENLQSLCEECHNKVKQRMERDGFSPIGADGMPISKDHPWNTE